MPPIQLVKVVDKNGKTRLVNANSAEEICRRRGWQKKERQIGKDTRPPEVIAAEQSERAAAEAAEKAAEAEKKIAEEAVIGERLAVDATEASSRTTTIRSSSARAVPPKERK